jgi:hypothetical protein
VLGAFLLVMRAILQSLALALVVCIPLSVVVAYAIGDGLDAPDGPAWYGFFFYPFFLAAAAAHRILGDRLDGLVFVIGFLGHVLPCFIAIHLIRVMIRRRRVKA